MDGSTKQMLSERIKNATNILVTVSRDPSVDELSAALALTLMLNKMDKHGTAVFSGAIPPAIGFLQPEKTFEGTVDSLRDFIIALDKEKADRLRYKVEDDVVRIFITPYKTVISEKDLQFSQGDFNVELIIALGVEKREDLDTAITAHGRILHDATVSTINAGPQTSDLGSIDWSDPAASSLCEMLMSLSESLQPGILDQQIATALLTGIVAATDRFSNTATSPKVMTMAAQLMAAGANQQLIATKLEAGQQISEPVKSSAPDGSQKLTEGQSQKVEKTEAPKPDGELDITHDDESKSEGKPANTPNDTHLPKPKPQNAQTEEKLTESLSAAMPKQPTLSVDDLKKDLAAASDAVDEAAEKSDKKGDFTPAKGSDWRDRTLNPEPSFGGTLNATTDQAAEDKRREEEMSRNHKLLSHDGPSMSAGMSLNGAMAASTEPPTVDPFAEPPRSEPDAPMQYEPTPVNIAPPTPVAPISPLPPVPSQNSSSDSNAPAMSSSPEPSQPPVLDSNPVNEPQPHVPTLAELEEQAHQAASEHNTVNPLNDARAAVDAALSGSPFDPANQPLESAGSTPFPPIAHSDNTADGSALPPPPPLPDFSTLPPLPGEPVATTPPPLPTDLTTPPPAAPAADPAQFKLPGQP